MIPQAPIFETRPAANMAEIRAAHALRHHVFCVEQGIFESDIDAFDEVATTIVAVAAGHDVVGTVRIHEAEPALWFGSRLAVAADWRRRARLGAELIGVAVGTAHGRGCRRFLAHVQAQNVGMFQALHWLALEEIMLHGRPHCLMQADLAHYPAIKLAAAHLEAAA